MNNIKNKKLNKILKGLLVVLFSTSTCYAQMNDNNFLQQDVNNNFQNQQNQQNNNQNNNFDNNFNQNVNDDFANQELDANVQNNILKNYNLNSMTLEEALSLESQITRAKLEKQLNKELEQKKPKVVEIKPEEKKVKELVAKPVNAIPDDIFIPILKSIRGVNGNLKAWLEINKVVYVVKKGDKVKNWRILKITDDLVVVQNKGIKKTLKFNYISGTAHELNY